MGYQVCRWYDKTPRLGFAMQLLELAPEPVQAEAVAVVDALLSDFLGEGPVTAIPAGKGSRGVPGGKRWYDRVKAPTGCFGGAFERLKAVPEGIQGQAAERLLALFSD